MLFPLIAIQRKNRTKISTSGSSIDEIPKQRKRERERERERERGKKEKKVEKERRKKERSTRGNLPELDIPSCVLCSRL